MRMCIQCGKEEPSQNATVCSACGGSLEARNDIRCPNCGTQIVGDRIQFCPVCGAGINSKTPAPGKKKRKTGLILLIALLIVAITAGISGIFIYLNNQNPADSSKQNSNQKSEQTQTDSDEKNKPVEEISNSEIAEVKKNGKLVIGYTIYEPMNYYADGEFTGFDTEFAEAVCKKLGVDAKFVEIEWDKRFELLGSKEIDCIWNGMTITENSKENCDFSMPYVKSSQVVVMPKNQLSKYPDVESLKGLTIAAGGGSAGEYALIEYGLDANMISMTSQGSALSAVATEMAEACIIDCSLADILAELGEPYDELGCSIELAKEEYGIGFRKGSDLKTEIDKIINELKNDGTLDKLSERYGLLLID